MSAVVLGWVSGTTYCRMPVSRQPKVEFFQVILPGVFGTYRCKDLSGGVQVFSGDAFAKFSVAC